MKTLEKRLIEELKDLNVRVGGCSPYEFFYAFMMTRFSEFSKKELKDIIMELYFELYTAQCREATPSLKSVADELEYKWNRRN